jgi:mono/diheme cytochrome c family protein
MRKGWLVSVLCGGVAVVALGMTGCSRVADSSFTLRADAEQLEIPEKQKTQIEEILAFFHGTPTNPRMSLPGELIEVEEEAEAETNEDVDATDGDASDSDATPFVLASLIERVEKPGYDPLELKLGHAVYTQRCAGCHGTTGDGQGPAGAHLNPPPRDYRKGVFKFTSTPRGSKPRREDLRRILIYGAKGTSMPAFRWLPEEEREAVIDYVQVLAARGELELSLIQESELELDEEDDFDPEVVAEYVQDVSDSWDAAEEELVRAVTVDPPVTDETIHDGAVAFVEMYCVKCHNRDAAGSKTADVGEDVWGRIAYPANLSLGMLHGGRRPIDIYRRIYSGINGTPMPSSKDPNTVIGETEEERSDRIWHLVHFVTTVIENNGVPEDAQAAIDETIARLAKEAAGGSNADEPEDSVETPEEGAEAESAKAAAITSGGGFPS